MANFQEVRDLLAREGYLPETAQNTTVLGSFLSEIESRKITRQQANGIYGLVAYLIKVKRPKRKPTNTSDTLEVGGSEPNADTGDNDGNRSE